MGDPGTMLSSEDTVPSTPPRSSDHALFSDEPSRASSPPSSPPTFPWEQQEQQQKMPVASNPPKTAFSILGKRRPLSTIDDNRRPAKKAKASTTTTSKPLTQMQISAGQRVQITCSDCGMEYIKSSAEDRKLHDIYHKQQTEGYDVGRDFVGTLPRDSPHSLPGVRSDDAICVVDWSEPPWRRKKAQAVLEIVQKELGAVPIDQKSIWNRKADRQPLFTAYMYVRGTRCIGFLLLERIEAAMRVTESEGAKDRRKARERKALKEGRGIAETALNALQARRRATEEAFQDAAKSPIQISVDVYPARLGVSRIWTSPAHRGQSIARTLLDKALAHQEQSGMVVDGGEGALEGVSSSLPAGDATTKQVERLRKEDFAFSQPTDAGARLARRWFGRLYGWGVYVD